MALLNELMPERRFMALHRYSVTDCDYDAQTFDGQPSISKNGLPAISKVPIRAPWKVELTPGSSVLVGFESADPAYPYVAQLDQSTILANAKLRATGNIEIGESAAQGAVRLSDMVITPMQTVQMMFATIPAGDTGTPPPSQMMTMVPYYVSVNLLPGAPPVFPSTGSLSGVTSTCSGLVKIA